LSIRSHAEATGPTRRTFNVGELALDPSLARDLKHALVKVFEEKKRKALKPAGAPRSQDWDCSPAYAPFAGKKERP
jgi:hypothetical protein